MEFFHWIHDPRKKKIRLYTDEQGNPKGDGKCRYLRVSFSNLFLFE